MAPPTRMVSLRLAPDVLDWIQARAAADQRSLAFIVMALARAEMAREAKAKAKTKTKKAKTAS
jgi:hypothetical protein